MRIKRALPRVLAFADYFLGLGKILNMEEGHWRHPDVFVRGQPAL